MNKIKIELDIEMRKDGIICSPRLAPIIWGCKVSSNDLLRYTKGKRIGNKYFIPVSSLKERYKVLLERQEELEKHIEILNNILKTKHRRNKNETRRRNSKNKKNY